MSKNVVDPILGIAKHLINKEESHPYYNLAKETMKRLAVMPVTQAEWDSAHINWSRWKSLKFWPSPSTNKNTKTKVCKKCIYIF